MLERKNLNWIILIVVYQHEKLMSFVSSLGIQSKIEFIINEVYDKTNNIFSLLLAKEHMTENDTLLLESDLIFEEHLIDMLMLLEHKRDSLTLVDKFESWMAFVLWWIRTITSQILFQASYYNIMKKNSIKK